MRLVDIDKGRLESARRIVPLYKKETGAEIDIEAYTDRRLAFQNAGYIICAVKIGVYIPLEKEGKIAEAHGYYCGIWDRVSGYYGGVCAYWQIRFMEEEARNIEEICPKAVLIQTANPVFEGTNYVTRYTDVKAVGVCHGHYGYREVAQILGLDLTKVTDEMVGFNYCIYLNDFRYEGKRYLPASGSAD